MNQPTPPAHEQPPTSFGGLISNILARVLASKTGKALGIIFTAGSIYLYAVVPAWQQLATLPGEWAKLTNARQEAEAAIQRQAGEAKRIAEQAKLNRAEADAVLLKAKGDADAKEAEADKAGAESIAAPDLQKSIADEAAARAKRLIGTATAARDQAKATADKFEAEARHMRTEAQAARAITVPRINEERSKAMAAQQSVTSLMGKPLPEIFSFDSDK